MKYICVGAAALNQTPLDWHGNRSRIVRAIELAREQDVSVLCLPELCVSGYGCEDAFHAPAVSERSEAVLESLIPETRGLVVAVGLPVSLHSVVYDAVALLVDGELVGLGAKSALAGDGLHYEPRWFKPWPGGVTQLELAGRKVPIGDLVFDVGDVRIGFEICEDAWVSSRPGARLAASATDLILNTSASHFAFDKADTRRRLVTESSRALGVAYVYANLVGNEAGRAIYDGHTLVANGGALVQEGRRFSFEEVELCVARVDLDQSRVSRARVQSHEPQLCDDSCAVRVPHVIPEVAPAPSAIAARGQKWEQSAHVRQEELTRAISLGLFDYMRKSRTRGFVVSLSGGADSAAVATLVRAALSFAEQELGPEGLQQRLDYFESLFDEDLVPRVERWLTTVYQASENSSEATRASAKAVANALGARHIELDIQPQVDQYRNSIEQAVGRELSWSEDDIALQNIQARVRAPGAWFLANLSGALLLATSNRSEAAVGYATMDGDTCGGLSPIAGIDKAFLREWLSWYEMHGPSGLAPLAELSHVNALTPTAELRPAESGQTDEDDLMPYPILDAIERAAIRDWRSPREILRQLEVDYPIIPRATLEGWVERFFVLFAQNQWKRERYAPSFHLDDENLDPKTWCRFPILSGGFRAELDDMLEKA